MDRHYSTLELVKHDETARAPERDWDATAFELDASALAPQVVPDTTPQALYDNLPPEVHNSEESTKERAPSHHTSKPAFKWSLMAIVLMIAVAIAIGVGIGMWRRREHASPALSTAPQNSVTPSRPQNPVTSSRPTTTSAAQYILNDTSLAALVLAYGDRQLFFQANNGSIRSAVFTESENQWNLSTYFDLSSNPKSHTPLAATVYNSVESINDGDSSSLMTIGLQYVSENHILVSDTSSQGNWSSDPTLGNCGTAVDTRSLSFCSIQQTFFLINPHPRFCRKTRISRLSHQNHSNTYIIMGRTKGAIDLPEAKRGALIELKKENHTSNRQLARQYHCDKKTVANVLKRAGDAQKENINPLSSEAHQRRPQSGRPLAINERQQRQLVRHATKNKFQRRKPWVRIARELGIMASKSAINSAFVRAGYGRYPPRHKPLLTPEMKEERLEFVTEWGPKLEGKEHIIVHTDETSVRVGESRGQIWVTRLQDEAYHKDCVDVRYRGYTELMFWAAYTSEMKGPSYMFGKETAAEKEAAKEDLADRNADIDAQQQIVREQFLAEQAKKPKSRRLKRIPKVEGVRYERNKNSRGGIDWYRYQTYVLLPRLIPFIKEVIEKYGECYLVQDGAPSHNAWQQNELLEIEGLTVLPWPGNSPDLNQIEPCWYHLKQYISKQPYPPTTKEPTIKAWDVAWRNLEQERIGKWCGKMRARMERVILAKGDNKFHG